MKENATPQELVRKCFHKIPLEISSHSKDAREQIGNFTGYDLENREREMEFVYEKLIQER